MEIATRLEGIGEYYFSRKLREIDLMNQEGKDVINLGIGSPDLPPHPEVIRVLQETCSRPDVHGYQSYKGSPVFRQAVADWYKQWYRAELDPGTEILPLIGSKEGILHICMTYLGKGDIALVPDPGYPAYRAAVHLAGGRTTAYRLHEKNKFRPDIDRLMKKNLDGVKLMFVNYPHMPTGQLPDRTFFEDLVHFAEEKKILVVHDNPYSFILNDDPRSLLEIPGAKKTVIELNSLSKSHNMAGWRVGMLCGAKEHIDAVLRFKSNMDSGMFLPVQLAAAAALRLPESWYRELNQVYRARREQVYRLLETINSPFSRKQAGLFVWAKIPFDYDDAYVLSDEILYRSGVFVTPGGIFGDAGRGYIRVSLCCTEERLAEAVERIKISKDQKRE